MDTSQAASKQFHEITPKYFSSPSTPGSPLMGEIQLV